MVFLLLLLTAIIFLAVDLILRREDRAIKETEKSKRSPIFLSPEKALRPLGPEVERLYHLSHSWALSADKGYAYVGYDGFIPTIFSSDVKIQNLPAVGALIPQGTAIWKVQSDGHEITQLSPVSGEVVDVNPACKMGVPLPSDQLGKSWIVKIKPSEFLHESNNLMNHDQAMMMNTVLRDELLMSAHIGNYINDGGRIDPSFIKYLPEEEWDSIIHKFFPYMEKMK